MRTQKSVRNVLVAVSFQVLAIFISFFSRQIFISALGEVFLGLEGLYTNILEMLSLAELGFATAILVRLYQPIADNDIPKIRILMAYFRKVYIKVGLLILAFGLLLIPFLDLFMKNSTVPPLAKVYYVIYLLATVSIYFFAYKSTLILANQDKYLTTIIRYSVLIVRTVIQMVLLIVYKNYLIYLLLLLIFNVTEGLIINYVANKKYPYILNLKGEKIEHEEKRVIIKNVRALLVHNIGGVVITSTDNIVISAYLGLVTVGMYSNYYLIFSALHLVLGQIFNSITASVGNLSTLKDKNRLYQVYNTGRYINALLFTLCAILVYLSTNEFITLWVGADFVLDVNVFRILVIVFFINGMRKITLVFRDSLGLYWYDRHKPLIEATMNLTISIILVNKIGLIGVFLGTLISVLLTSFWVEPFVVYKYGFEKSFRGYIKGYVKYCIVAIIVFTVAFYLNSWIAVNLQLLNTSMLGLLFKQVILGGVSLITYILITIKTEELDSVKEIVIDMSGGIINKIKR